MYQIKAKTNILSALCCLALAGCGANVENSSSMASASREVPSPAVESLPSSLPERQPEGEMEQVPEKMSLKQAVVSAVLEENRGKYFPGEYQGAGCKIFETFAEGDKLAVYALIEYTEYGFEDDRFVNVSGTRARVRLDFQTGEAYTLTGYTVLDPTSGLSDAELEELMAPLKETGKEYLYTDKDFDELREQVEAGAREYLKSIGREGVVSERDSHEDGFLSRLGSDAYHALVKDMEISSYPDWEGTLEKIEDGIRYVYQARLDKASNQIEYTKTNYDTGETAVKITVDAATGERINSSD